MIKAIREAYLTPSPQETSLEQRPEGVREPGRQVPRGRGFRQKGGQCEGPGVLWKLGVGGPLHGVELAQHRALAGEVREAQVGQLWGDLL